MNALKKFLYEKDPLGIAVSLWVTPAELEALFEAAEDDWECLKDHCGAGCDEPYRCRDCKDCCG